MAFYGGYSTRRTIILTNSSTFPLGGYTWNFDYSDIDLRLRNYGGEVFDVNGADIALVNSTHGAIGISVTYDGQVGRVQFTTTLDLIPGENVFYLYYGKE